jgi:hypothetical protein
MAAQRTKGQLRLQLLVLQALVLLLLELVGRRCL